MTDESESLGPGPPPEKDEAEEKSRTPFGDFFTSRLQLAQFEAGEVGTCFARRLGYIAVSGLLASNFYLLAIAGLVGWISSANEGWTWYYVALVMAAIHLIPIGILVWLVARPVPKTFPHTRSELAKDLEWLETLKKQPKSPD